MVTWEKAYTDSDGKTCTLWQMVKTEPEWAANRIKEGERAIADLAAEQSLRAEAEDTIFALRLLKDRLAGEIESWRLSDKIATARAQEAEGEVERLKARWLSVDGQMPVSGRKVIAYYENVNGKPRRIMAFYAAQFDIESSEENQEGFYEYSEANDQYFLCEGWYENNEFDEINWHVDGEVTHWQPLPEPPAAETVLATPTKEPK